MESNQKPNELKKIDGAIAVIKKDGDTAIIKDAKSGGVLIGKAHADEGGGIAAVVVEDNRKILIEAGEVIINKHAAKKHWRKLNEINQSAGNGAAIHEPQFAKGATVDSKDKFEKGAVVNSRDNKIKFDNFHLDTFADFKKIKASEIPKKEPDFVSKSGSKYWHSNDSVIRQSNHWGRTIGSCNWLLNSSFHKGLSQGICSLNDFEKQQFDILKPNESFKVKKTVLERNGKGSMSVESLEGVFVKETSDYYVFDKFRIGKQSLASASKSNRQFSNEKKLFGGVIDGNEELFDIARIGKYNGDTPEKTFYKTGYFIGLDGKWRTEIDDHSYLFKFSDTRLLNYYERRNPIKLSNLINHDDFFTIFSEASKIYVYLHDISTHDFVKIYDIKDVNAIGEFVYNTRHPDKFNFYKIDLYIDFKYIKENGKQREEFPSESSAELIILHELQHIIQLQRNFRKGASYSDRVGRILKRIEGIRTQSLENENSIASDEPNEKIELENRLNYFSKNTHLLALREYEKDPAEIEARSVVTRFLEKNKDFPNELDYLAPKHEKGATISQDKTYIVSALRTDGRMTVKVFDKKVSNLDVYNYFKNELNIEIVDSTIQMQEHSGFDAVSFLRAANELCLDLFGSEIKDSEELIFSFDRINLQVYDFSCTLEDNTAIDIEMIDGVIIATKKENEKFLYGGGIDFYENRFSDIGYKWKISTEDAYRLCDSNKGTNLDELIEHKEFFSKYPLASRIKVYFESLLDDEIEADSYTQHDGTTYHFSEIVIKINKLYYTKNGTEKHTTLTGITEYSKECCLLHEIQHICQQADRKPTGRGYKEIHKELCLEKFAPSNGRTDTSSEDRTSEYAALESIAYILYKSQHIEQEAMKSVFFWLSDISSKYTNTEYIKWNYENEKEQSDSQNMYAKGRLINSKKQDDEVFLHGGKISKNNYLLIDDTHYTWKYNQIALYALYMSKQACELEYLIDHPVLFEKYKGIGQVKVLFFNGEENKGDVEIPKTLDVVNNFDKCIIKITLNFKYYAEHYKEFKTIDSNEPDLARESILLHELQHILQAVHNRPSGTSYARASKKANARVATLRANEKAKRITIEEQRYLAFYDSLDKEALNSYFYYNDDGELEARKVVRKWLKMKGIRYVDPLTEEFGIPIYDDEEFENGGGVKANVETKKTNLDNSKVSNWSDIPAIWKQTRNIQNANINSLDPKDKVIQKISQTFCGKDELRPVMSGVFFDEFGFVMTDAHKLFFKQGKHLYRGIYPGYKIKNDKVILTKKGLIDGKYPNYQAVIPTKTDVVCEIDVLKLYTYITACKNYTNKVTHAINFAYGKDEIRAFNSDFLEGVLETFLSLGEGTIYAGFQDSVSRAIIFSPDSAIAKKPHEAFSKKDSILMLLMPVMAHDDFKGARELDFSFENSCYFDFKDNEIHNEDGSIVKLNENESLYPSYINSKAIGVVKVFTEKNDTTAILDCAEIKNGTLHVTDNEVSVTMSASSEIEGGTYYYVDKYLRKAEYDVDEYPSKVELGGKNGVKKNVAIVSLHEFLEQLNYANLFIEKDNFRPERGCANLIFSENKMQIFGTDAQCMYKNEIPAECKLEREIITMQSPKVIAKILSVFDDQPLVINVDDRRVSITGYDFEIIARKSDSKYPDVSSLIPATSSTLIEFQTEDLLLSTEKNGNSRLMFVGASFKIGDEIFKGRYKIHQLSEPKQINTTRGIYIGSATKLKQRLAKINSSSIDAYVSDKKGYENSNLLWIPLSESKTVRKNKLAPQKTPIQEKEYTKQEIKSQWKKEFDLAEKMIDSDISDEEMEVWGERFDVAEMMLN